MPQTLGRLSRTSNLQIHNRRYAIIDFSTDILEIEPHLDSSLDVFNVSSSDQYMQFPLFDDVLVSPISSVEMSSHMELATKVWRQTVSLASVCNSF